MLQTYICTTSGVLKHRGNVFADDERFFFTIMKKVWSCQKTGYVLIKRYSPYTS